MLLTTLSLFHLVAALLCRDQRNTIFDRDAIPGVVQLRRYGIALLAIVAITGARLPRSGSSAPPGSPSTSGASASGSPRRIVVVEELIKLVVRRRRRADPEPAAPAAARRPSTA